ncbi:MAG: DUF3179 domain-containing protein [Verrucomicrobia bacterium]|nr:DUF3179 domain-containing protein [Verrucomicrobiota bacterium]
MIRVLFMGILMIGGLCSLSGKPFKKGFDLENASIPLKDIKDGGPGRDGIPAIDSPNFLTVEEVRYLKADDLVMSVSHEGITRAYPIRILNYHEIVNDTIGSLSFAVTYCPLCGTGMVFNRELEGEVTTFGVSGLLYQSDVLLYDRATESLWSQLLTKAVAGPRIHQRLEWIASEFMTWESWKNRYTDGEVLSDKTGHRRNYRTTPYQGYERTKKVYFPVPLYRDELETKHLVMGIELDGEATAYDLDLFVSGRKYKDKIGGHEILVSYDQESRHAEVKYAKSGELIPHVYAYWFAWQAFHPNTRVMSLKMKSEDQKP